MSDKEIIDLWLKGYSFNWIVNQVIRIERRNKPKLLVKDIKSEAQKRVAGILLEKYLKFFNKGDE